EYEQASSSCTAVKKTILGSLDDAVAAVSPVVSAIGGKISDVSTWLFGTPDDVFFGPNWKQINDQYNGMSEQYLKILERKKMALEKPDNETEVLAIKSEIENMKLKYESLRKSIRTEQRNVGFAATFWGEEYMGRYIQSIADNFDPVNLLMNAWTKNIKLIYDVFRPAILLEMGAKYLAPKGNLTPQIHDALVKDVMGLTGSSSGEQVTGGATGWVQGKVIDKAQEEMLKKYEKQLASEFAKLKDPLINKMRQKVEGEMKDELMAYLSRLPYEKLPGGSSGTLQQSMESYLNSQAVRQKWISKLEESTAKEIEKITEFNIKGASKKFSDKLGTVGTLNDVFYEWAKSP
ncbi:MAG: hypothetical protein NTZ48_03645, partial [Candidatus Omnitrophica bacterium]|nr:hypothetical protein [Candidatus Omnitrophota bacterium]